MQTRLLHLLACCLCTTISLAQQYPFVYYTPKDGLVNSRVKRILQDSYGRMYFLTYGGLSVYDGARFTNYHRQNGLAHEVVNDVAEVAPDSFFVAVNTNKLNVLVRGRLKIFETSDGFCPIVNRFIQSKDGYWYASSDDGFYRLQGRKFQKLNLHYKGEDVGPSLDKIVEYGNYFFLQPWSTARKQKLIVYHRKHNAVTDVRTGENICSLQKDSANKLWVATPQGLYYIDTLALQQGRCRLRPAGIALPFAASVGLSLFFDSRGLAWIYGGHRVQQLHSKTVSFSAAQGLRMQTLSDFFVDREGICWMSSDGDGVAKLKSTGFRLYNKMGSSTLNCIGMDYSRDTLWLLNGTERLIYRISKGDTTKQKIMPGIYVGGLYQYADKLILLSGDKLLEIDKNQQRIHRYPARTNMHPAFGIAAMTPGGVLLQVIQKSENVYIVTAFKDGKWLSEVSIPYLADQLCLDAQNDLWVITRNNHLMRFSLHPETPQQYLRLEKDFTAQLNDINPRSLACSGQNTIWIGSRYDGLYQFRYRGDSLKLLKNYSIKDGLTDNFICRLATDGDQNIWVGTQTGLDKLTWLNNRVVIANIGKSNGLFKQVLDIKPADDGSVWVRNNDGSILHYTPEHVQTKSAPRLLLTSLTLANQSTDTLLHRFAYGNNSFTVHVAAPSFFDESGIRYSYQLEGSGNENWSEPSSSASFSFINLAADNYVLNIRAIFPEGIYADQHLRYAFTVLPPWWQTIWFRLALAGFVLGGAIFAIRYYYKQRLKKQQQQWLQQQAIERERTRIATDMHDDLGAGLSRIKFLSETIGIKKQQQLPIEEDIGKIRDYSHEMISKMGEIVWALNEKNDTLSDLLSFTRAYATEYLTQNGIQCRVQIPDDLPDVFVTGEFRRNIFLSVKEALHNVVKHAAANEVSITVETDQQLRIIISDDGKGFTAQALRPFSNGLSNMQQRTKSLGGRTEMTNEGGTKVVFETPLPH